MRKMFRRVIASALALALTATTALAYMHATYGNWWTPGAYMALARAKGFLPNINVGTIPGGGASLAALAKGLTGADNGAQSINTYEYGLHDCAPGGECIIAGITTRTHPYEMVGLRADWMQREGAVANVLRDVRIGLSDCRLGHTVRTASDALDGAERYTADGLMMKYVVDKNAELAKVGLPTLTFFCGTKEEYQARYPSEDASWVIYGYPRGDSPKRLHALEKGEVDMALVTMTIAAKARAELGFVDAFDQAFLPRLPAAGIVMARAFYETTAGQQYLRDLCTGIAMTRVWLEANKEEGIAFFRETFEWKGSAYDAELERVYTYAVTNMGGCTIERSVMEDAALYVGGRALSAIAIAETLYTN